MDPEFELVGEMGLLIMREVAAGFPAARRSSSSRWKCTSTTPGKASCVRWPRN